ncbi:MAG: heavy metal-associated domain-containing protein [Nanoarchaeota archaeon]
MKKLKLNIMGMHCASCAVSIDRSLRKISGVKDVRVSALINKAFVESEDKTSEEEMKKAVARAGYKVVSIEKD